MKPYSESYVYERMDTEKLKIAVVELKKAITYPLEIRIAKYLVKAGYSGMTDDISKIIREIDNTIERGTILKVYGYMRDLHHVTSKKHPHHIDNVPDLFP